MSDQAPRAHRADHDFEQARPRPTTPRARRRNEDYEERFGAGVCATGVCDEPCGQHGGCIR